MTRSFDLALLRCALTGLGLGLAACGGAAPISMTCRPARDATGVNVAAIELHNDSSASRTVLGMSVPWFYRHAVRFSAPGFSDPHVIADPGEYETLILLPGDTVGGEVAIGDRLLDTYGRSVEEIPGEHPIELRALLVLDPDTAQRRNLEARCTFDLAVEPRAP